MTIWLLDRVAVLRVAGRPSRQHSCVACCDPADPAVLHCVACCGSNLEHLKLFCRVACCGAASSLDVATGVRDGDGAGTDLGEGVVCGHGAHTASVSA